MRRLLIFTFVACIGLTDMAIAAETVPGLQRSKPDRAARSGRDRRMGPERTALIRKIMEAMGAAAPSLDSRRREGFERTLRRVVDSISDDEVEQLKGLSLRAQITRVKEIDRSQRRARDEKFLSGLDPAEAASIRDLPTGERVRRITDLRLEQELETAIANAMAQGLITEASAAELRSSDRRAQLEGARKLNKATFFHLHQDDLPNNKADQLKKIPAKVFFADRDVRSFRLLDGLDERSMKAIRSLDPKRRQRLLDELRVGTDGELMQLLSPASAKWVRGLTKKTRHRLAREVERIRLSKSRRVAVPRHLKDKLSGSERKAFMRLSDSERVEWLKARFPNEDWDRTSARFAGQRQLDQFMETLGRRERRAIGKMPARRLEEFFKDRVHDAGAIPELMRAARARGWGRRLRLPPALARRLKPDEERKLAQLPPDEALLWSFRRFRRELLPAVGRLLKRAGLPPLPGRDTLPSKGALRRLLKAYGGHAGFGRRLAEEFERRRTPRR